jgi:hypothetical protein
MNAFPAKSLSDSRKPVVSNTEPSQPKTTVALGYRFCARGGCRSGQGAATDESSTVSLIGLE